MNPFMRFFIILYVVMCPLVGILAMYYPIIASFVAVGMTSHILFLWWSFYGKYIYLNRRTI